jgi:hypothetical protein
LERIQSSRPLVLRAAALLALSVLLGAYYTWHESLRNFTIWWEIAILTFLVIPAVTALVYLVLPLWRKPHLLPAGVATAVLAVLLQLADLDILANFAKLVAVTLIAFWAIRFFEMVTWVLAVALIIPWVDLYSVWRGPTKHIVTERQEIFTAFSFSFPVPGEHDTAQLGLPDLLFFALFLAAADRWNLRVKLTWLAMSLSFGATLAVSVAFDLTGFAALPFLSLGFVAPNADLLWGKLREQNAWGQLAPRQ